MNDQTRKGQEIEVVTRDGEIVTGLPQGYEGTDEVTQTLAVALTRAEIEQQIVTARAMPRSITRSVENIVGLATLDEESAEECIYALPRAGKAIKGPSIRLAEIIQSCWGNCRSGTRVVHVDRFEKYVEAEGIFHDLETNSSSTSRVRRRISDKRGKLLTEDMIIVTGNAACAIAKRNAILAGVPKAVWRKAYNEVERVIAGDVQTLVARRDRALAKFARYGVVPEQVFAVLEVGGVDDVKVEHLPTLTGMFAALKSGESNVEEMFPKVEAKAAGAKTIADKLDAVANGGDKKDAGAPQAAASGEGTQSAQAAAQPPAEKPTETVVNVTDDTALRAAAEAAKKATTERAEAVKMPAAPIGAPKQESAPAAAQAPATATLSQAAKTGLQRMHTDMMGAMSLKKVQTIFATMMRSNEIGEGDPIYLAGATIRDAHVKRVGGDGSPAECDAVVRSVIA